ncbi:exodeoxyribonuclease V subunit gamma [Neisseriaceae bacterium B1]
MLYLYQSNCLENLAQLMLQVQQQSLLSLPLQTEQIVVQSQGMRRYITQYLAKNQGIAANMCFHLPAGLSWQLMRELLPDIPALSPFSTEVMRWRLLSLFQSPEFVTRADVQAAYAVLRGYLGNGDYAAYQLAGEMADIFDQYLVYRPDWIEAWSKNQQVIELKDNKTAIWQAQLWRFLDDGSAQTPHRAALWRDLMEKLNAKQAKVAPRYCVFGMATLAPMYLTLLKQLSLHSEVHIFALNPSAYFWGNVIEPAAILASGDVDLTQQGHPLLASLGKQGRDFFNQLAEAETFADEADFHDDALSGSLLHSLQHQIQMQTLPENAAEQDNFAAQHFEFAQQNLLYNEERQEYFQAALISAHQDFEAEIEAATRDKQRKQAEQSLHERVRLLQLDLDDSIQIHSAHSPLRELQILKDRLWEKLSQNKSLQPHDIAVLTPNIEPYAPFIEAVFGKHCADGKPLSYSVADIKRSTTQPFMQALGQLFDVLNSRFEADKVLALLEHGALLQHFDLTREDLPLLHDTITQLNIHWGADAAQRRKHGDDDGLFTWEQGLNRLIAGWMLPENRDELWQGISPFAMRTDFLPIASRFVALIHTLMRWHKTWQTPATIDTWIKRVRTLIADVFTLSGDEQTTLQQWEQSLVAWQEQSELADFQGELSAIIAVAHMRRFLDGQSEAGFLRGGITFCSMVPMRSLPFKILCLLGLNDGDFPRSTPVAPFDLIARHSRMGDRARRDDDRYLFLEAIMSARETLYLSFLGKDIRNDEERAPSVLLNELIDTLAAQIGLPAKVLQEKWIVRHPLQAFSRQYFSGSLKLFSTRQDYAQALNQPPHNSSPFMDRLPENATKISTEIIDMAEFLQFWRNPVRHYLQHQLNWQSPYTDENQEAAEPFEVAHVRTVNDAYLQARRSGQDFAQTATLLRAQSQLPAGLLGDLTQQKYANQARQINGDLLNALRLPAQSGMIETPLGSLNFRFNSLSEKGQILTADQFLRDYNERGKLTAGDKIELLLRHLIFCAANLSGSLKQTHFIGLDIEFTLPEIETESAKNLLAQWLAAYHVGQQTPLPFFARVQFAVALEMSKPPAKGKSDKTWENNALSAASKVYHNGYKGFAQEDYPEVKLVFGRDENAEPPYRSELFQNLTENLLLTNEMKACLLAIQGEGEE